MENIDYSGITELDLSYKKLNELPDLSRYTNLIKLNCTGNRINNLDNLPSGLEILYCCANNLTKLDNLPYNLKKIVNFIISYH